MRKHQLCLALVALFSNAVLADGNVGRMGDADAIALIHQMEADVRPSAEIVGALVQNGRTVADATALVVGVANTQTVKIYSTLYGMCLAVDKDELAEDIGAAARAAAGPDDEDIQSTVSAYDPKQCDRFFLYLRPPGAVKLVPNTSGVDPILPVSPSN